MGLLSDMTIRYRIDLSEVTAGISKLKSDLASVESHAQKSSGGLLSGFKKAGGGMLDFASKAGMAVFGIGQLAGAAVGLAQSLLEPNAAMEQGVTLMAA